VAGQHAGRAQGAGDQCTKAVFFPIGKHAGWNPEILKQVAAAATPSAH